MTNKYGGKCSCGRYVAPGAGTAAKGPAGKWELSCGACNGEPAPAPVTTYDLTEEQAHAVDLFAAGATLAIEAGAGTGKTSTLVAIANSTSRVGTYVAFNKAAVTDAAARMPGNVGCSTAHSLAFRSVGKAYAHRLNSRRMPSAQIAKALGIEPIYLPGRTLQPGYLASHVMAAVGRFCYSTDPAPSRHHFPYLDGLDTPEDGRRTYEVNNFVAGELWDALGRAWSDLSSPTGSLRFSHDHYLKVWALGDPRIPGDYVLADEAQDLNPVLADVIARQAAQVIYVGDSQQELYEWRGATDALAGIAAEQRAYLTTSFRFGQGIADVANTILDTIAGAEIRLTGAGPVSTIGPTARPDAVLTRTNGGAISAVLAERSAGRSVHLVGGGAEIGRFARGAEELMRTGSTEHPELACFRSWEQVKDYAEADPLGAELAMMVQLIDRYGVDTVLAAASDSTPEARADVVVSTVHKAKGREWTTVQLGSDFPDPDKREITDPERRLLYVAATRAKRHLDYTQCAPLVAMLG